TVLEVNGAVVRYSVMTFNPPAFDANLTDILGSYLERGGRFWVLVDDGRVVGTVAVVPAGRGACEVKRLYLLPAYRGRGLGRALMEQPLGWATAAGYRQIVAWSDARLTTAHGVYERMGFGRFGERTVEDADRSREYGFTKELAPSTIVPPRLE